MIRFMLSAILICLTLCMASAQTELPVEEKNEVIQSTRTSVNFTLRNNSTKSIPLIIPTVMNPNLSPMSNSGVRLKMGQKVFFKAKGKRQVLLVVDDSIEEGAILEVSSLLKERKKALGIK